jgi:hypothetical protein
MHDVMPEGVHILPKIKEIFDKLRARIKTKSDLAPCINSLMRNTDLDYRSGPQQRVRSEKKRPEESNIRAASIIGKSETKSSLWNLLWDFHKISVFEKNMFEKRGKPT